MTVRDVLKFYNLFDSRCDIMYRTIGPYHEDIFVGVCRYDGENKLVKPLDGDSYSLDDEVIDFALEHDKDGDPYLIIWDWSDDWY